MAGLDPASLLELDGRTFDAVELAALNVEYLHLQYVAYLAAHGVKGNLGPLELDRPHEKRQPPPATPALTPTDFAFAFGPARG